jgi:hypothetical protein
MTVSFSCGRNVKRILIFAPKFWMKKKIKAKDQSNAKRRAGSEVALFFYCEKNIQQCEKKSKDIFYFFL